tara:strand:- start:1108 stop:1788 length:681 start_codon:yes stop_codon:yes gene_type:complete
VGEIILKASKIFKSYDNGEKTLSVLNDLSIEVKKNEIITITGQSGSGKSTLLNILGSLDRPDFGEVLIDGVNIFNLNNNELAKLRNEKIGFVFQFHHLLSEFTSLENVLMPVWIGNSSSEKKDEATDLFAELNLSSKIDCYPNQLSGGERLRVALIRGIINKPKILLADEPTGNLDEKNALVLIELLKKINTDFNQSIIITTHNPDVAKLGYSRYNLANGVLKTMR